MRNPQTIRATFGIIVALSIVLFLMAGAVATQLREAAPVIIVLAVLVIGPTLIIAWARVLLARCPHCGERAFLRGSLWFGSSWGVLGNKCVHCGAALNGKD